jgi:hypothetical protein
VVLDVSLELFQAFVDRLDAADQALDPAALFLIQHLDAQ